MVKGTAKLVKAYKRKKEDGTETYTFLINIPVNVTAAEKLKERFEDKISNMVEFDIKSIDLWKDTNNGNNFNKNK